MCIAVQHHVVELRALSSNMEDLALAAAEDRMESRTAEYRKVVKPLLEKRRRARMNNSLNELKAFIVDAKKAEISDPSKLEKADILELTVRYLRELRRHQRHLAACVGGGATAEQASRFCAGFTECAHEVSLFLAALPGLEGGLRARLLTHVGACLTQVDKMAAITGSNPPASTKSTPSLIPLHHQQHHHPYNQPHPYALHQRPPRDHTPSSMPRPLEHHLMVTSAETGFKVPHLPPSLPEASFKTPPPPSSPTSQIPPIGNPIHPEHVTSLRDGFGPGPAFGPIASTTNGNDVAIFPPNQPEVANETINMDDVTAPKSEPETSGCQLPSPTLPTAMPQDHAHAHSSNSTYRMGLVDDRKTARSASPVWRPW